MGGKRNVRLGINRTSKSGFLKFPLQYKLNVLSISVQVQGLHLEWINNYNTPQVTGTRRVAGSDVVSGMDLRNEIL